MLHKKTSKLNPKPAILIAKQLLSLAEAEGNELSEAQLHIMTYVCHGTALAHFGQGMILEDVLAWKSGPVIPSIHIWIKHKGALKVSDVENSLSSLELALISQVYGSLSSYKAYQLKELVTAEGSPSSMYYKGSGLVLIPDSVIKAHYLNIKASGVAFNL